MIRHIVMAAGLLAASPACAADLGVADPASLPFSWAGFYVGAHAGYAWGQGDAHYVNPILAAIPLNTKPAGFYGGVQAGYNFQTGRVVLGGEADISFGDVNDKIPDILGDLNDPPGPYTITAKSDYSGTVRARLGYSFDRFLPYLTGGYAWSHTEVSSTDGPVSDDAILSGWVLGAGAEYAFDEHWSAKAEYLHADFGDHTWFPGTAFASKSSSQTDTIRLGFNYRF